MKEPKTVRGYIQMIRRIELICPTTMKGFEELSEDVQDLLKELNASISNIINEIK